MYNLPKYKIGYLKAKIAIENGISEEDLLFSIHDISIRKGVKQAYIDSVADKFKDSRKPLNLRSKSRFRNYSRIGSSR